MNDLLTLIKNRQSARVPFDTGKPVSRQNIGLILEAGSWAPTAHNMQNFEAVVVDDKSLLDEIRNMEFSTSEIFIRENYAQLSFSEEELKRKKTGVLGTMFPKSWLDPANIGKTIIIDDEKEHPLMERHNQLLSCPALIILLYDPKRRAPASEGDFLGVMSIGCVLENMWLMASSLGIGFHVVSALSGAQTERKIKKLLGIPDQLTIAISFRLGYPLASPGYLRVRRDLKDFAHYNGFEKPEH